MATRRQPTAKDQTAIYLHCAALFDRKASVGSDLLTLIYCITCRAPTTAAARGACSQRGDKASHCHKASFAPTYRGITTVSGRRAS